MDSAVVSNYICLFLVVQFHSQNTSQQYGLKSGDRSRSSKKKKKKRTTEEGNAVVNNGFNTTTVPVLWCMRALFKSTLKTLKEYIQGPDDNLQFYVLCLINSYLKF